MRVADTALLDQLGIEPVSAEVPTAVHTNRFNPAGEYFTPPGSALHEAMGSPLTARFADDLAKFERMMSFCRKAVSFFTYGDDSPSFYKNTTVLSQVNPLNFVSAKSLIRLWGMCAGTYVTYLPYVAYHYLLVGHVRRSPRPRAPAVGLQADEPKVAPRARHDAPY